MRVLILSALLACAAAAPSGAIITPLASVIAPVAIPAAIPTIPPGDIEAAAINAQVEAEDRARALADKEREIAEAQAAAAETAAAEAAAAGAIEEKAVDVTSEVKENADDSVWTEEDKKWQALEALNVAQARLQGAMAGYDGAIAANAPALAKSAISGAVLVPAPYFPTAVFAAPGIVAPVAKAAEPAKLEAEAPKPETIPEISAPLIETKSSLPLEGDKTDSVAIEAEKTAAPKPAESEIKPIVIPFSSILAAQPLALAAPWAFGVAPIALPYAASTTVINGQLVGGQVLHPTVLKTQW